MGTFYKARLSTGEWFLIEVEKWGGSEFRSRLLGKQLADEQKPELWPGEDYWCQFGSAPSEGEAVRLAVTYLNESTYTAYVCEVLSFERRSRAQMSNTLVDAVFAIDELRDENEALQRELVQVAAFADQYKQDARQAVQEMRVAADLALEVCKDNEVLKVFVAEHVKGEA